MSSMLLWAQIEPRVTTPMPRTPREMLRLVVSDLVPALNGVQEVAGSNPAVPTLYIYILLKFKAPSPRSSALVSGPWLGQPNVGRPYHSTTSASASRPPLLAASKLVWQSRSRYGSDPRFRPLLEKYEQSDRDQNCDQTIALHRD